MSLEGKNIILGISGGIAAYKAPLLLRLLQEEKAKVQVVATKNALQFVTLTTLETLSGNPVVFDLFDPKKPASTEHIDITDWADGMVVAPATANVIGKFAAGIADDALTTTLLSFTGPIWFAPAMNVKMWNNPQVQKNIEQLKALGYHFIEPAEGYLACGYEGKGRMQEPRIIVDFLKTYFTYSNALKGKKFLVTAGPTYERIDPVRFIGNFSSGKMGYAIAQALQEAGAEVTLVSGPTHIDPPTGVKTIFVESAYQMYYACLDIFPYVDGAIMAAAVADFKPAKVENQKIKKSNQLIIVLEQNPDILKELGRIKTDKQLLIGFALETHDELQNAQEKLRRKNADLIVLNSLQDEKSGFGYDTNKVTLVFRNEVKPLPLLTKREVAQKLVEEIIRILS